MVCVELVVIEMLCTKMFLSKIMIWIIVFAMVRSELLVTDVAYAENSSSWKVMCRSIVGWNGL